jgi:hypothetical protein
MAKMTKNTLKSPKIYRKINTNQKKWHKNLKWQKMTYKSHISVTTSSSPWFIYLRALNRIQEKKKMTCHQNLGPGTDNTPTWPIM